MPSHADFLDEKETAPLWGRRFLPADPAPEALIEPDSSRVFP
jgi:hypothetical protein